MVCFLEVQFLHFAYRQQPLMTACIMPIAVIADLQITSQKATSALQTKRAANVSYPQANLTMKK